MADTDKRPRFFVPDLSAEAPARAELPPAEAHHALHVLRLRAGAAVELFDGRGQCAEGHIADAARRRVTVAVERAWTEPTPASAGCCAGPLVHLAFAVPKGSRADWLVEKATELGVASLRPTVFERSVAGKELLSAAKRERWMNHCAAAAKQAQVNWLPVVEDAAPLAEVLARAAGALVLAGDTAPEAVPILEALARRRKGEDILIVVGPEGGLAEAERATLRAGGAVAVRLGRSVLRIETAAIALAAAAIASAEGAAPRNGAPRVFTGG
jgi:16S rRNA (uracil1498-N3)-methyltransferase